MADGGRQMMMDERFVLDVRDIRPAEMDVGRRCTVCDLPEEDRNRINAQILSRVPLRTIAHQFSLTHWSVLRHFHRHLWPEVQRLLGERADMIGGDLMDAGTVIADLGRARAAMARISVGPPTPIFDADGNLVEHSVRDQIGASKVLHGISRTALELTGRLKGSQTNVAILNATGIEGQIQPVIDQIMTALAGYPEAQLAVAAALSHGVQSPQQAVDGAQVVEAQAQPAAE